MLLLFLEHLELELVTSWALFLLDDLDVKLSVLLVELAVIRVRVDFLTGRSLNSWGSLILAPFTTFFISWVSRPAFAMSSTAA